MVKNLRGVPWWPEMSLPLKLSSTLCSTWRSSMRMEKVMLIIWFYRVNKGGWELLQFSHPASIRDDPGPIRDDRRPARHLSWFTKIRTIVSTWRRMMVLVCWRCSIIKWFLTVAWFQALSSCIHVVNLRKGNIISSDNSSDHHLL